MKKNNKRTKKMNSKFPYDNRQRLGFFCLFIFTCIVGLIIRITVIIYNNGGEYEKYVLNNQQYDSIIAPFKRGDIKDSSGTVLAYSTKVYNLILDPGVTLYQSKKDEANGNYPYVDDTIKALKLYFNVPESEIREILNRNDAKSSHYIKLRRQLTSDDVEDFNIFMSSEEQAEKEKAENYTGPKHNLVKGVWLETEYKREYPYGSLACDVIGYASSASSGAIGLENYYNDILSGVNGVTYGYVNDELNLEKTTKAAIDGYNIVTTLDFSVQSIIETKIKEFNEEYGSKNTAIMVMNPNNGEIVAMASYPVFDLNNPRDLTGIYSEEEVEAMDNDTYKDALYSLWKNFCVSEVYEPGSTIKPFTIAAALEEGYVTEDEVYLCDGSEKVLDHLIHCHNRNGHGMLTLTQTIMQSCNDALMQIGLKIGDEVTAKYQDLFGYGRKTYVDIPGEEVGITKSAKEMDDSDIATNSFGQNFNVTMIQLATAYCSLINGGYYYQPHLVKRIETGNGDVVKNVETTVVKQTITASTSDFLKNAMFETVASGTAKRSAVKGYEIGGKTGTAEKYPRGNNKYVISFIGFAPVDNPQFVLYVVIDEPQNVAVGSSAPVCELAKTVLESILPYLNVFPEEVSDTTETDNGKIEDEHAVATDVSSIISAAATTQETTEEATTQAQTEASNTSSAN